MMPCALALLGSLLVVSATPARTTSRHRPRPPASASQSLTTVATTQLLERATSLYEVELDYPAVRPLLEEVLKRPDLTPEQEVRAFYLLGCTQAILDDPLSAGASFQALLSRAPDFELDPATATKVLAAFEPVKKRRVAVARRKAERARAQLTAGIQLLDSLPRAGVGGQPLKFSLRLRDPTGAVDEVRVPWRRRGRPTFDTLALVHGDDGAWRGAITPDQTANENGAELELWLEAADKRGVLVSVGNRTAPLVVPLAPGLVETRPPPPLPRGVFFTALAATLASGATLGGLGIAYEGNRQAYVDYALTSDADADRLNRIGAETQNISTAFNVTLITAGTLAVSTVIFALLTDWRRGG